MDGAAHRGAGAGAGSGRDVSRALAGAEIPEAHLCKFEKERRITT